MENQPAPPASDEPAASASDAPGYNWKRDCIVLTVLLVLAVIGLAVTQAIPEGAWEAWLLIVLAYAGVGIWRAVRSAKAHDQPVWPNVYKPLMHWASLLVALKVLVMLERSNVMSRESASDGSLLLLALASFLSGVHFDPLFMIVGLVLLLMTVAVAAAENYAILITIGVCAAAIGIFYWRARAKSA